MSNENPTDPVNAYLVKHHADLGETDRKLIASRIDPRSVGANMNWQRVLEPLVASHRIALRRAASRRESTSGSWCPMLGR